MCKRTVVVLFVLGWVCRAILNNNVNLNYSLAWDCDNSNVFRKLLVIICFPNVITCIICACAVTHIPDIINTEL